VNDLEKIAAFIDKHHVMSFATTYENALSVCSLFYAYERQSRTFVVASSDETTHVLHAKKNPRIAGNILLETKSVGKIQGLQFWGEFAELHSSELQKHYFKRFPYALALKPKLWSIRVSRFKMTDNTLGFGKKILWEEECGV
jgi:uncharacterized protein YhbP (UPF0306 family)